jgi:hypothetical protein
VRQRAQPYTRQCGGSECGQGYVRNQEKDTRLNRSGKKTDTDNLVRLVLDMKADFDADLSKFGLSAVLTPDITYL